MKNRFIFDSSPSAYNGSMETLTQPNSRLASTDAQLAHVFRRLTMTSHPGAVERSRGSSPEELALTLIDQAYASDLNDGDSLIKPDDGDNDAFVRWWLDKMWSPAAGVRERMTWFWHNHMPSSFEKSELVHVVEQHRTIERLALGNFRDLLQALTVDAAMLHYLDGAGSRGDEPNENYAREVMELFALGVGNYTEDDIRVAARGLSGWFVNYETKEVEFASDQHYDRPLRFFGTRKRWTNASIIDAICDQPACAVHVARSLYQHVVGGQPSDARLTSLAATFRDNDLEIRPLLEALVTTPEFLGQARNRARSGVEYLVATVAIFGTDSIDPDPWWLWQLGQVPYYPPNVAGWPGDERWLNASQVLGRTNILFNTELSDRLISSLEPEVDDVLHHCGIFDASDATRAAMAAARDEFPFDRTHELLLGIALSSPEFALA